MSSAHPPMIYDYSGFPEHTYHIKYPAPWVRPILAQRVQKAIARKAGFSEDQS
jgi:aromatic ring-opening dioxygenase catalytic subunit (LigB family)